MFSDLVTVHLRQTCYKFNTYLCMGYFISNDKDNDRRDQRLLDVPAERHRQNWVKNIARASKKTFLELATLDFRMISNALSKLKFEQYPAMYTNYSSNIKLHHFKTRNIKSI